MAAGTIRDESPGVACLMHRGASTAPWGKGRAVLLDIWLVIIGLMVIAGIGFRLIPHRLPFVQLHKVAPKAASLLVGEFIESSYDGDFCAPHQALPGGDLDRARGFSAGNRGPWQPLHPDTRGPLYGRPASGSAFGCLGSVVALVIAVLRTPAPDLRGERLETLLKYLLRSEDSFRHPGRRRGCTWVAFELRGPVALRLGRRRERAFHAPVLLARVATLAGIPVVTAITADAGNPVPAGAPVPAGILAPGTEPVLPGPLPADPVPPDAIPADGHPQDGPAPADDGADPSPA